MTTIALAIIIGTAEIGMQYRKSHNPNYNPYEGFAGFIAACIALFIYIMFIINVIIGIGK